MRSVIQTHSALTTNYSPALQRLCTIIEQNLERFFTVSNMQPNQTIFLVELKAG